MSTQAAAPRRMSIVHALVAGAAVAAFLFILLWGSAAAGVGTFPSEFTGMFKSEQHQSVWAPLLNGMPLALSLGAAGGAAIAVFANMFKFLDKH